MCVRVNIIADIITRLYSTASVSTRQDIVYVCALILKIKTIIHSFKLQHDLHHIFYFYITANFLSLIIVVF